MKIITAAGAAAIALGIGACGGSASHPAAASRPVRHVLAKNPVQACLQLQQWQLSNHGQGISASMQRQLRAETLGTPLGTDIVQWQNDLAVTPSAAASSNLGIAGYARQVLSDSAAVGTDCNALGVRNTLGG